MLICIGCNPKAELLDEKADWKVERIQSYDEYILITPTPTPKPTPTPEPTPEPTPTPYFGDFGEKFHTGDYGDIFLPEDERYQDENGFKTDRISITIERHFEENLAYFVADIYVKDIISLKVGLSHDAFGKKNEKVIDMAIRNNAIVAINGDYYTVQEDGIVIRNGELYKKRKSTRDLCVLYKDGTMKTYSPKEVNEEEILANEPWHSWAFGPMLVHEGEIPEKFNSNVKTANPRAGIGYYEPGHYCFVVVDGRQRGYSAGLDMQGFAELMKSLGCVEAYNMDGGATAVMCYMGEEISKKSSNDRGCSDIIYIGE